VWASIVDIGVYRNGESIGREAHGLVRDRHVAALRRGLVSTG